MVDVLPVILKFWAILESRFSKCGSFFQIFFDFIVIWGFLIELKQNNDWQLLLLERSNKAIKSRQFALRDPLISCQVYAVGYMYML